MDSSIASSDSPPHLGLLRDETILLRLLLGYCDDISRFSGPLSTKKLRKSMMRDVLFLGLDVDALQTQGDAIQQFHIGVSVIDTRSLKAVAARSVDTTPTEVIESHHFVVGDSKFSRKKSNKFLFGRFEAVSLADLQGKLKTLTAHRDVVLVLHGGSRELWVLESVGINLQPICVIDTVKAAQHPLQLSYRYSLERLLDELGIPFNNLHSAGNDAHFVLRAVLMIAVRDAERLLDASALPRWLPTFRAIAQAPLPCTGGD